MATPVPTPLKIRVQAKGGKYLGNDIGGAEVTIRDAQTGQWLTGGQVLGDSGQLQQGYVSTASPEPVIVPGSSPSINWLTPGTNFTASCFNTTLQLTRPTLLEIEVYGPIGGLQSAQRVVTRIWAVPGQAMNQEPGVVVEFPGLIVQVKEPSTHYQLSNIPSLWISANVTMMCGCPIASPTAPYWPAADFTVTAVISQVGAPAPLASIVLSSTGVSSFWNWYLVESPGYYQVDVNAVQKSTGNIGTGSVTFFATP